MEKKPSASARLLPCSSLYFLRPSDFQFCLFHIRKINNKKGIEGNRMTEIYIRCSTEQIPYVFNGPGINSLVFLLSSYQTSLFLKETSLSLFLLWNLLASFAPAFVVEEFPSLTPGNQAREGCTYFFPISAFWTPSGLRPGEVQKLQTGSCHYQCWIDSVLVVAWANYNRFCKSLFKCYQTWVSSWSASCLQIWVQVE